MNTKYSFIIKWSLIIFSKIPAIFCVKKKKRLYQEILENVKKSKVINYPIDKNSVNFFFISNEINKLINVVNKRIDETKKYKIIIENCFKLYFLLITSAKLQPSIIKKYIIEFTEEKISKILNKNKIENIDHTLIPYTIYIRRDKALCNLINELNVYCSNYIKKINNIKTRYLIIDKNEITIDEEWKKKHEYIFNKNKLKIPISKHNYEFILYGISESNLRKEVLNILINPYKNKGLNRDVINILKKRYEIANKCGYDNWSHYSVSHFTSEKNNYNNLSEFFDIIKKKIDKDYDKINFNMMKLFNLKKKSYSLNSNYSNNSKLDVYDWYYYYNKMCNKTDEYFINTFFPQHCVLNNFIEIISKIYNFTYERIKNKEILKKWPKNSIIYKIERGKKKGIKQSLYYEDRENIELNDNTLLGYIYIIPYMKITLKDYFKIPSMNSLSNTYLICNGHVVIDYKFIQTVPLEKKLFSSSEILTLFHEFGHAYHLLILSNKYSLHNFYNIPLDYAEFFSHINEHLVNNYNIIFNLSNKETNNSKINENLYQSIKFDSSRLFNIYIQSLIDYKIHDINPFMFFANKNKQDWDDEYVFNDFYQIIENYVPYKFSSLYSIHSTSFPYHFSCYYSGSVLSYLLAEIRVILQISTNDLSLKKNNSLISFQKKFYNILSKNFRDETYPSIIKYTLSNKNILFNK